MLLAWLPLQAAATPWLVFKCDQYGSLMHTQGLQQQGGYAHHTADASDASSGVEGRALDSSVHGCCHHLPGAAAGLLLPSAGAIASGVAPRPLAHAYSFFPEPLKRPPLAGLV